MRVKYIRDKDDNIIVFPDTIGHNEMKHREPKSAGFISFGINKLFNPSCHCHGESVSLGLKADIGDTRLALMQILGYNAYDIHENMP
jgi:hypothetical protein